MKIGNRDRRTSLRSHFIGSLIFHAVVLVLLLSVPLHTGGAGAELIHLVFLNTGETGVSAVASQEGGPAKAKPAGRLRVTENDKQDTPILDESSPSPTEGEGRSDSEIIEAPAIQESSPEMSHAEPGVVPEDAEIEEQEILTAKEDMETLQEPVPEVISGTVVEQKNTEAQNQEIAALPESAPEPAQPEETMISTSEFAVMDPYPVEEQTAQPVNENMAVVAVQQKNKEVQAQQIAALPESASEPEQLEETVSKPVYVGTESSRRPSSEFFKKIIPLVDETSLATGGDPATALKRKSAEADSGRQIRVETRTAKLSEEDKELHSKKTDSSYEIKAEPRPEKKPEIAGIKKSALSGTQKMNSGKESGLMGKVITEQNYDSIKLGFLKGGTRTGSNLQQKQSETSQAKTGDDGADKSLAEGSVESFGIKEAKPELRGERISSAALMETHADLKIGHPNTNEGGTGAAEQIKPEKVIAGNGGPQDAELTKKTSVGLEISEALFRKDIKIIVVSESPDASVAMGLFRRSAAERQRRAEPTFRQEPVPALIEKTERNMNNRPGLRHLVGVSSATKGVYTFILTNKGEESYAVQIIFHLFEGKATERIKEYNISELHPGRRMEFKFILPNALFWDDEERFSGSIEDSSSTTKFHYDSGLVWKENKKRTAVEDAELFNEEIFLMSEETSL